MKESPGAGQGLRNSNSEGLKCGGATEQAGAAEAEGLSGAEGREVKENALRVLSPGTCLP